MSDCPQDKAWCDWCTRQADAVAEEAYERGWAAGLAQARQEWGELVSYLADAHPDQNHPAVQAARSRLRVTETPT